ncbi:hypothetical protein GCM10023189_32870 [Nibrella saemangeumensis]|uniref:THIF-type NAD/FAD binding fold domain-containing protein n=1 Tax=Nibrella saemangeumensis TaxID=1084526 RepID=A0ABP8N4P7_9BACT
MNDLLEDLYRQANPFGNFTVTAEVKGTPDYHLFIGGQNKQVDHLNNGIWIDGSGWLAGFGSGRSSVSELTYNKHNPIGPAFAACLGVAEVFRRAIGEAQPDRFSSWYSLFDFEHSEDHSTLSDASYPDTFDLGRVYEVGCGAIGSSFAYLLSLTNWRSTIHFIDFDPVDYPNLSSSLLFTAQHAEQQTNKAQICQELLATTAHIPHAFDGDYSQFVEQGQLTKYPPDLIVCFANDRNVWSTIQANYPPLTFHATTTKSWGINFGRHIPEREWCIMCRFHKEVEHTYVPVCGQVEVPKPKTPAQETLAILPFLSPASAIIVLAELAKLDSASYPVNENFIEYSFKRHRGFFLSTNNGPKRCYVCKDQSQAIYEMISSSSKYNYLMGSPPA